MCSNFDQIGLKKKLSWFTLTHYGSYDYSCYTLQQLQLQVHIACIRVFLDEKYDWVLILTFSGKVALPFCRNDNKQCPFDLGPSLFLLAAFRLTPAHLNHEIYIIEDLFLYFLHQILNSGTLCQETALLFRPSASCFFLLFLQDLPRNRFGLVISSSQLQQRFCSGTDLFAWPLSKIVSGSSLLFP